MDGYSISRRRRADRFPASTLRFYERSGLVRPARSPAGYRCDDDHHLELLSPRQAGEPLSCRVRV
jgi:DNA-binding transcriptional MerR regulator